VVNVTTTRTLIDDKWLAPYRIFSCAEPDMSGVRVKSTGEWDEKEASGKALEVVGDVVQEYLKHGENRKFICSAVDTVHVQELASQFIAAGINVATYTYLDKDEDRADTTLEFRKPDSSIRGLITVTAASRGFDVPDVSCVIMARPLRKSLAEHIQLFGRGLRISDGKENCLVLDHSGNCARFWEDCESFFDFGVDKLDDGKPKEKKKAEKPEAEPMRCPTCRALHKPAPFCPACGHAYPKKAAVQHVPGTLKELIAGGYTRELTRDLWPQVCGYVLERREGDAARRQALAIYRGITGEFPRGAWFESTTPVPPSTEVRNRIRSEQIKFAKGRQKAEAVAA
jgi:DNA repair protein RadD